MNLKVRILQAESILCHDRGHAHPNPIIDMLRMSYNGHAVLLENVRGSDRYTVQIDDQLPATDLPGCEVDGYIFQKAGNP